MFFQVVRLGGRPDEGGSRPTSARRVAARPIRSLRFAGTRRSWRAGLHMNDAWRDARISQIRRRAIWCSLACSALAVACGARNAAPVRACATRWNHSIAKAGVLRGVVRGDRANIAIVGRRCRITLMGPSQPAFVFTGGHSEGYGGFLFAGAQKPGLLPPAQREANAAVGPSFLLKLK
jgi:hypothetical protein